MCKYVALYVSMSERDRVSVWGCMCVCLTPHGWIQIDNGKTVEVHLFCLRLFIIYLNKIRQNTNSIYKRFFSSSVKDYAFTTVKCGGFCRRCCFFFLSLDMYKIVQNGAEKSTSTNKVDMSAFWCRHITLGSKKKKKCFTFHSQAQCINTPRPTYAAEFIYMFMCINVRQIY